MFKKRLVDLGGQRLAEGRAGRLLHEHPVIQRVKALLAQDVGLSRRYVDPRRHAKFTIGNLDLGQGAPRWVAGYPASIEQDRTPARRVDEQADDIVTVTPAAHAIVNEQGRPLEYPTLQTHAAVSLFIVRKRCEVGKRHRRKRRALGVTPGQRSFFVGTLELPEAEPDKERQEQRRDQGCAPLKIKHQACHVLPTPAGREAPLAEPLYWRVSLRKGFSVLKILIVIVMVLLVVSLASGAYFLMADQDDQNSRRTLNSLGVRLGLALGLMGLIIYGVASGQLGHRNPWDAGPASAAENP